MTTSRYQTNIIKLCTSKKSKILNVPQHKGRNNLHIMQSWIVLVMVIEMFDTTAGAH